MGRERYHQHQRGHSPAAVDVRLASSDGSPRTDAEYRQAFRDLVDSGVVPAGWTATAVRWGHEWEGKEILEARSGQPVRLADFGAVVASVGDVDIGIERSTAARHVTREKWVQRVTVELVGNERWVATGARGKYAKGQFVPAAYARRYPHLVTLQPRTRRKVQRREKVREQVTVVTESAIVRVRYEI